MHVLVVEPDTVLGATYAHALQRDGNSVALAPTAQLAVQAADAKQPDAIVLNIDMPRHNGLEFLYEFKSYPEWQHIPVILLVARINHDMGESSVLREQLGVRATLVETQTDLATLCQTVRDVAQVAA